MLYPANLNSKAEKEAYRQALKAPVRYIRVRPVVYNRDEKPLGLKLEFAADPGEIVMEWSTKEVVWSARLNFIDRNFPLDGSHTVDGKVWWAKLIGVRWGIWVEALGKWAELEIFRGYIGPVSESGGVISVDCAGKERQHLEDYPQTRSKHVRKGAKIRKAIRHFASERGERRFAITSVKRELPKGANMSVGATPWKTWQNLARRLPDHQLYYRPDGRLGLRKNRKAPVWNFTEGADSILLDKSRSVSPNDFLQEVVVKGKRVWYELAWEKTYLTNKAQAGETNITVEDRKHAEGAKSIRIDKDGRRETREVTSVSGTTIHFTKNDLDLNHPVGTPVWVKHEVKQTKMASARVNVPPWHPWSANKLSDSKRPRAKVIQLGKISKVKDIDKIATQTLREGRGGIQQERGISCLPIPGLEPMDVVRIGGATMRVKRYVFPLSLEGTMEINHSSRRMPSQKSLRQAQKAWRRTHGGKG